MTQKVRVWDFVLAAALILASLLVLLPRRDDGGKVEISVDGAVVAVLPLSEDGEYAADWGRAVIRDGNVWMEDSVCPDHLCEKTGSIRKEGQVILCLPEKVALRIIPEEVDAVVG